MAYLIHGDVNTHAMAWLLVGSIPGVLIGSQIGVNVPERGLRVAFGCVLILSGIKVCGVPQATYVIAGALALGALVLMVWGIRRLLHPPGGRAGPGIESPGFGPAPLDRVPRGAAGGHGRRVRAHRAAQAPEEPDLRHEGRPQGRSRRRATATRRRSRLFFRLRKRDHLTVWMEHDGKRLRTLVSGRSYPAGPVTLAFDGISDDGLTLPDGVYRPVVRLKRDHRTIELPNTDRARHEAAAS